MDLKTVHTQVQTVVTKVIESELKQKAGKIRETQIKAGAAAQSVYVTKEDLAIDRLLREELTRALPEVGFVSEEGTNQLKTYNWVIDPIDGTGNFSHGLPYYGISLGLWHNNEPVYGTIHLPALKRYFYSTKEQGVFDGQEQELHKITSVPEYPFCLYAPVGKADEVAAVHRIIGETVGHPRDLGSCVYQATLVFEGKADVFVGYKLSLWDIGALTLMAQELDMPIYWVGRVPDLHSYEKGQQFSLVFGRGKNLDRLTDRMKEVE